MTASSARPLSRTSRPAPLPFPLVKSPDPLPGRDLAAFAAAVEAGSIQGAADALDLTQSAATKRLQALERRVGVPLLERGRHGVRPTTAGERAYPAAKEALAALARVEDAVAAAGAPIVRLAASHTIGEFLLPVWLVRFRAVGAPVRFQLTVVSSKGVVQAVRGGAADVGFIEAPAGAEHGLEALLLARDEIVCVVGPDHPWARRTSVPADRLGSEPFLTREAGSGTRAVAVTALAAHGVALEPSLEAASAESLKRAVRSGGFTLLSRLAVDDEARTGALRLLPVHGVELRRELRAVRRPARAPAAAPRRLWGWLEREVADAAL